MKIALTSTSMFTSKKGDSFVKVNGISAKGEAVSAVVKSSDYNLPMAVSPTPKMLHDLFETFPVVDVDFNQDGFVDSVHSDEVE